MTERRGERKENRIIKGRKEERDEGWKQGRKRKKR